MRRSVVYARNIILSIASIAVFLIALGTIYTWYVGSHQPPKQVAGVATKPKPVAPTVPKQDLTRPIGVSVQSISSPVAPGDNAVLNVRTGIQSECVVKVEYNKVPAKDSGLVKHPTDEYGMTSWSWTVDPATPLGSWPVEVTCTRGKNSAMVRTDLVIKSKADLSAQ